MNLSWASGDYWSSSEYDRDIAWFQVFDSGIQDRDGKFYSLVVRLVALYQELPVFRDVYRLMLRVHQLTQGCFGQFRRGA